MPFELSEETRRLLDFLSRQQAFSQQDQAPTAVLGDMQTVPEAQQAPAPAPASAEAQSVNVSPAMDELRRQIQQQIDTGFSRQVSPQQQAQPTLQTQSAPAQQTPARQEQASGTDLVNRAVESALRPQAPNPVENKLINDVLAQKIAYDLTEQKYKAAQDEAVRQGLLSDMQELNKQANFLRDTGKNLGVDLSGYGEGVSLQDADRNLYTKELQELMHMSTGRYSMTANQFYESEYSRQIMSGASPNTAARRAARSAREYQADRVAYLNGLYNSYGRDGLVTNPLGNQILLNLAADDPTAANFYAQVYPNTKNAYERQNKLEDDAIAQTNALAKMAKASEYNTLQQLIGGVITRQNQTNAADLADRNAANQAKRTEEAKAREAERAFNYRYKQFMGDIMFAKNLIPDADIKELTYSAMKWTTSKGKDKESAKDLTNFYKNMIETKQKQKEFIMDRYKDSENGIPQEEQDNINQLDADISTYTEQLEVLAGIRETEPTFEFRNLQTDEQIKNMMETIWEAMDGRKEPFLQSIEDTIKKSPTLTERKKGYIRARAQGFIERH